MVSTDYTLLERRTLHCMLHRFLHSAMSRGVLVVKASKVELSSARPRHRPLRWRRQGRLVVYR